MFSLNNKTAVITGGGSGIGKAIAFLFGRQGALVHIIELNVDAGQEAATEIKTAGGIATVHGVDVSDQQQVVKAFNKIGKVDILVNCAGVACIGNVENTSADDFDHIYNINVKGVYNCLYAAIPHLKANGKGVILNVGSVASHVGIVDRFAYSMSKGAVFAMSLSVARDYIDHHIRCNSISPARVHTPFVDGFIAKNYPDNQDEIFDKLSKSQPIGRMGKPDEIASLALFLCSDEAEFITGCDYPIDGGFINLNN